MDGTPHPDWEHGGGRREEPGGAPPAHLLCRRVLLMVQELHRRGYERLRVAPGLSRSGLHWGCSIVPASDVRPGHGAIVLDEGGVAARYDSAQGAGFFGWDDAENDTAVGTGEQVPRTLPRPCGAGRGRRPGVRPLVRQDAPGDRPRRAYLRPGGLGASGGPPPGPGLHGGREDPPATAGGSVLGKLRAFAWTDGRGESGNDHLRGVQACRRKPSRCPSFPPTARCG